MKAKDQAKPVSRAALAGEADPRLVKLSVSIQDDAALFEEDIRGSRAHAAMLASRGIVPEAAARRIDAGLARVREEFAAGRIPFDPRLEDVHTHVERRLGEIVGKDAGYLHAGRSRRPSRSTSALHRRRLIRSTPRCAGSSALVGQARRHERAAPGVTKAQPVSLRTPAGARGGAVRDRRVRRRARRAAISPLQPAPCGRRSHRPQTPRVPSASRA
jgi:argininosuccinate lyase